MDESPVSMNHYFLVDLGREQRHGYIIGGQLPKSDPAYSPLLDIGFNRQDHTWQDEMPHLHTNSEEYYIVLHGRLDLVVNGSPVTVEPYQLLGIRSNMPHQIVGGRAPITSFLLRVPGNSADKVNISVFEAPSPRKGDVVRIDLKQPHNDYLLGACLPLTNPNFSPFLDFTCVWDVEPADEWRQETPHFHAQREEYYFVLKGILDMALGDSILSVKAGQIIGVRSGAIHKIIGGKGPVDVLFVRVPGGRGDKTIVESKQTEAN